MAMAIDSRQQQQPFSNMGFDALRYSAPHFTNPWVSAPASQGQLYATSLPTADAHAHAHAAHQQHQHQQQHSAHAHRFAAPAPVAVSSAGYASGPISAPALPSGILSLGPTMDDLSGLQVAQDGLARSYGSAYSSAAVSAAPATAPFAAYGYQPDRRPSHPSVPPPAVFPTSLSCNPPASAAPVLDEAHLAAHSHNSYIDMFDRLSTASEAERQQFSDALDASRGMVAMSQSDITPRNIYGVSAPSARSSTDSYGFPSTHSSHSSVSSASTYPSYYNSSVSEASVGDYSSASESVDMPSSRTLPRPAGLVPGGMPPAPQSMMGQFSSKVSSSSQKKHKCKICDKRFTRPSSLQTHMYSHTGEKPFSCDVAGCGRHFSVVSNLRRHRKVHKAGGMSDDHPSPDDDE